MNVEKLKKMNVLANTLKQHGLAATREDAANLAGEMVGTPEEQNFAQVVVPEEDSIIVEAEEPVAEKPGFDEQQVKGILQNFADKFCTEINKLNEQIDAQNRQIAEMKRMLQSKQVVEQPKPVQQTIQEEAPAKVEQKKSESPRSGNYASDDVSIEKFFYCGTK